MAKEYSREELWKLYEKIPQELKETIFSEETAVSIAEICGRNEIEDERISEIARYTGRVLLGILPPDEFQATLEKEVALKKEVAKTVAQEINRFVFYPVRGALEQLYKMEIAPPIRGTISPKAAPSAEAAPSKEEPSPPSAKDVYREPVE